MSSTHPPAGPCSASLALLFVGLAFSAATVSASEHHGTQRLVVRGDATVKDSPARPADCN